MAAIGSPRGVSIMGWRLAIAAGLLLSLCDWSPALVKPTIPSLDDPPVEMEPEGQRSGECRGGGCSTFITNYPTGTFSTTSASWTTVGTCINAGDYAYYSVTLGQVYEWSLCPADGGSASYDSELTLWNEGGTTPYCYSDEYCPDDAKIAWTATLTGTVRVLVTEFYCSDNNTCTTLVWRCASGTVDTAVISDAWWSNQVDQDGDGCKRSARLNWDPDVADCSGSLTVFEKIYWKTGSSGTWTLLTTTSNHTITNCDTPDAQYVDYAFDSDCGPFDWKIEVYRAGQSAPDYARDPSNDDDLNDHPEERAADDVGLCAGDVNCDGQVSFGDINPFVKYLTNFAAWQAMFPGCDPRNGDINGDGTYGQSSFGDINPFVALVGPCGLGCACPGPGAQP